MKTDLERARETLTTLFENDKTLQLYMATGRVDYTMNKLASLLSEVRRETLMGRVEGPTHDVIMQHARAHCGSENCLLCYASGADFYRDNLTIKAPNGGLCTEDLLPSEVTFSKVFERPRNVPIVQQSEGDHQIFGAWKAYNYIRDFVESKIREGNKS